MPVELAQRSLFEVLLRTSNVLTLRQIVDILGASPAAGKDLGFGEREGPLQVWHGAGIYRLTAESVWVLEVELAICSSCRWVVSQQRP